MLLDAASAKALATIILVSTQGRDQLAPQLPLQATGRGDSWLVKGTPFTDSAERMQYCLFHVFIRKSSAEVIGLGFDGRMILTEDEKKRWSNKMSSADFKRIFGLRMEFEPGGDELAKNLAINGALYGGLINKPADALDYAHVLVQGKPILAHLPRSALEADERSGIWYISAQAPGTKKRIDVMSFSRENGKVLSGSI